MTEDKIRENEILNEEELDQVAGGSEKQLEVDIANFKKFNIIPQNANNHDKGLIGRAFALFGIGTELHGGHWGTANKYFYQGATLNQEQAWSIVINKINGGYHPYTN